MALWKNVWHVLTGFLFLALFSVTAPRLSQAETTGAPREPIITQVIELNYADTNQLAATLSPLLSKHGSIVAYAQTNTLIIRDKKSLIEKLVRIIRGPLDPGTNHPNCKN
jgi:type II secretory pathway component GspD/PulD (secretin)